MTPERKKFLEQQKVCNIPIPRTSLEYGSCHVETRCCRNCSERKECSYPCQLSFDDGCEYYKGVR